MSDEINNTFDHGTAEPFLVPFKTFKDEAGNLYLDEGTSDPEEPGIRHIPIPAMRWLAQQDAPGRFVMIGGGVAAPLDMIRVPAKGDGTIGLGVFDPDDMVLVPEPLQSMAKYMDGVYDWLDQQEEFCDGHLLIPASVASRQLGWFLLNYDKQPSAAEVIGRIAYDAHFVLGAAYGDLPEAVDEAVTEVRLALYRLMVATAAAA